MSFHCPNCHSERVTTRNRAKKAGGFIGGVAGTASGAAGAFSGSEIGMTVGIVAGPPGMAAGAIAGAILGALFGAATCGMAGAKLGEVVDERILDNYRCLACNHTFSIKVPMMRRIVDSSSSPDLTDHA